MKQEKDTFGELISKKQEGWEYLMPFRPIQNNLLIIYQSGKYQERTFESDIKGGYYNFLGKDDKRGYSGLEIAKIDFSISESKEESLDCLTKRYSSSDNHNIINSYCDKGPEEITREHYYNCGLLSMHFTNWAIRRRYKRESEDR